MNNDFRVHIIVSLKENIRLDGRKLDEYRPIKIQYGVSRTAEGSAMVSIGETKVIAGVKMLIAEPFPDKPDEGTIMVNAELLPMSNPLFEPGPPGDNAIELARVVDRGIRESKAIDVKKLLIKKGEKCWVVSIDIITVNDSGNLFDASALAAVAAIQDTTLPLYENDEINYKKRTEERLPITKLPVSVTVIKIGDSYIVDPLPEEEAACDARLTAATTEDGTICALQKGGNETLSIDDVSAMLDIAIEKARYLRGCLKS
ncbi:MAG: exosome complex protein Rrp42 [Candidatus Woesearchaeota archaeon]